MFCETLETATVWANIDRLKTAVTETLRAGFADHDAKSLVMCHISHVFPTGAALYFTIIGNLKGTEESDVLAQWDTIKSRVNDTILELTRATSHHHGVGRDHAPWLATEIGDGGIRMLRALKDELDPAGIMNPGALLAAPQAG